MTDPDLIPAQIYEHRRAMRPTARTWIKHILLLLLTLITATFAGTMFPFGSIDTLPTADPQSWSEIAQFLLTAPARYIAFLAFVATQIITHREVLIYGISFSFSLLFILLSHEMGHYIACRIYGVDATLPYFIPTPPLIGPAGTFGAFIKIMSPMPSRRAVFDIGVAGTHCRICRAYPGCADRPNNHANSDAGTDHECLFPDSFLGSIDDEAARLVLRDRSSLWFRQSVLFRGVGRPFGDGTEPYPIRPARRRACYICGPWRENSLLDRADRLCGNGAFVDTRLVLFRKPERFPHRNSVGNNDADQAPRAMGPDAARCKKEGRGLPYTDHIRALLRALSDPDQLELRRDRLGK